VAEIVTLKRRPALQLRRPHPDIWAISLDIAPDQLVPVLQLVWTASSEPLCPNRQRMLRWERGPDVEIPYFEDGIGRRWRTTDPTGGEVETLRLRRELAEAESTEAALVERAGLLAGFSHPGFVPVLRVERAATAGSGLAIVSTAVTGVRLSNVLLNAERRRVPRDLDAARSVLAQVAVALADFHRYSRDVSHGTIGPERIIVCPDGRIVIAEPILAPALERMQMARTPLWTEFRVPVPPVAGTARFDQLTDVMQVGVLALALVLGRPIRRDEYPNRLHEMLLEAYAPDAPDALDDRQTGSRALRAWIHRTLQLEPRSSFRTAAEAAAAFEAALAEEPNHNVSPASVVQYLAVCAGQAEVVAKVPPAPSPRPGDGRRRAAAGAAQVPSSPFPEAPDTVLSHRAPAGPTRRQPRRPGATGAGQRSRWSGGESRLSARLAKTFDWRGARTGVGISLVAVALVALCGAAYLGARGYFSLQGEARGRGTLVIESSPAGIEVFIDGRSSGRTPVALDLQAGEHTVLLRSGRAITLVPVVVAAGARRVEHVDIRRHQPAPRVQPPVQPPVPPATLPPPGLPE
jgi:hypothetical protein